jgi:predicted  nucleic acid-binding Zn-ribbon protein
MDSTLYKEVTSSIKAMFDVTARIDERVKMLVEKQHEVERRLDGISTSQMTLTTKVGILENRNGKDLKDQIARVDSSVEGARDEIKQMQMRLITVEKSATSSEHKWKSIFDFIYKAVWVILVCYLLFKLNLTPPPLP